MNLLLDTDVLIYFLRGDKRIKTLFLFNDRFYYSSITKKELFKKPGLSATEEKAIISLLNRLRQIIVDGKIASSAEELLKKYRRKGLTIPDALIASTALIRHLTLVTFNKKHFGFIPELTLFPVDSLNRFVEGLKKEIS